MKAIYEFHPDYIGSAVWWGDPEKVWGLATLEGGDVLIPGNGVVLIGMSERSSRQPSPRSQPSCSNGVPPRR
jgi:arginine deiminase